MHMYIYIERERESDREREREIEREREREGESEADTECSPSVSSVAPTRVSYSHLLKHSRHISFAQTYICINIYIYIFM